MNYTHKNYCLAASNKQLKQHNGPKSQRSSVHIIKRKTKQDVRTQMHYMINIESHI